MQGHRLPTELIVPESFQQCFTYADQINYLYKAIQNYADALEDVDKRLEALEKKESGQNEV